MTSLTLVVVPFAALIVGLWWPDRSPYRRTGEPIPQPEEDL